MSDGEATNVRVMVRVRPFNKREIALSQKKKERLEPVIKMRGDTCVVMEYTVDDKGFTHEKEREAFQFDMCFWSLPPGQGHSELPFSTQEYVYNHSGKLALQHLLQGFNVCIFAYGQTGSGKTHSMLGNDADPGVSPRLVDELFSTYEQKKRSIPTTKVVVEVMFFEIYNEKVRDLFNKKQKSGEYDAPRIRQHPTKGVYVEGLKRNEVETAKKTKELLEWGTSERAMAETKMNATSSRSHAVFQIQVTQNDAMKGTQTISTINLVDLAGSEKVKMSGVTGDAFAEAKNINQSLSTLRRVIDVLIENSTSRHKKPAPFRESVLTYLLSDSLGGNSKTMMLSAISPHESNIEDTLGTLRYALRAKAIVCNAKVNEEKSAAMMDAMKDELAKLREQMASGTGTGGGKLVVPEEVRKEIEDREKEIAKMEKAQSEMNAALEEAKKREEAAKAQMADVEEQRQKLDTDAKQARSERFATTFRNALLISQDKKQIEESKAELREATRLKEDMVKKADELNLALYKRTEECGEFHALLVEAEEELLTVKERTDAHIGALQKSNRDLADDKAALQQRIDEQLHGLKKLRAVKEETEGHLSRMKESVEAAALKVDEAETDKERVKASLEEKAATNDVAYEEARKKKDHYKAMCMAEQLRVEKLGRQHRERTEDRRTLLETIKAQQSLLSEKEMLIARLQALVEKSTEEAAVAVQKEERKDDEIRILAESLDDYKAAAAKWMADYTAMEQELSHLRHGPAFPHTASATAYTPPLARQTPSAARVAREVPQPRVSFFR